MLQGGDWLPPEVQSARNSPFVDPIQRRIDDLEKELLVLISQTSEEDKRKVKQIWVPESANKELRAMLGCLDCGYRALDLYRAIGLNIGHRCENYPFTNC